eukprot:m.79828 g.79828  ORF g.79828 m.79828 type:complete len:562 (-) comp8015_c0_seq4:138-1823(-)
MADADEEDDIVFIDPPRAATAPIPATAFLPPPARDEAGPAEPGPDEGEVGRPESPDPPTAQQVSESDEFNIARGAAAAADDGLDDGQTCTICFEAWTSAGPHRIASLKCGHLFGKICIEKWLKGRGERCPQCNGRAKSADIRVVFAKSLHAIDNTEKEAALRELEKERKERAASEERAAKLMLELQVLKEENEQLRIGMRRKRVESPDPDAASRAGPPQIPGWHLEPYRAVRLSQGGGRILDYDSANAMLVASGQCTAASLFSPVGHGVFKLSSLEFRHPEYLPIHSKIIRDVRCCYDGSGVVLTTSLDKTMKITSTRTNSLVHSFALDIPAWTCAWDCRVPFILYAGLQNGSIVSFDTRNPSVPLFCVAGARTQPLTSIHSVEVEGPGAPYLLSGSISGVSLWTTAGGMPTEHRLPPLDGGCTWLSPVRNTTTFLSTLRGERLRHAMASFETADGADGTTTVACHISNQYSMDATPLMLRSRLVPDPGTPRLLGCVGHPVSKSLVLWDCASGTPVHTLPAHRTPIMDVCPIQTAFNDNYLAALMDDELVVYRWTNERAHS